MIIGQKVVIKQVNTMIDNKFPRFTILTGEKGSGKKTLAKYIASKLIAQTVQVGLGVEDVRSTITTAQKHRGRIVFIIPDADRMSISAKNSLLKVTEEPPNNAYFIMTVQDIRNTLETLQSRGTTISMQPYTTNEITKRIGEYTQDEQDIMLKVCNNIGQVEKLALYDIKEFYQFVEKVVDNIAKASGANALKIASSLSYKEEDEGYDIELFLKMFVVAMLDKLKKEGDKKYLKAMFITSDYFTQIQNRSINKKMAMDMWILDVRNELRGK